MVVRSVLALVRAQLTEIRRSKTALFWMTAFPVGFLLLFGYVMARGDARATAFMLPGLLTTTLMSGGMFGVALPLVQQRESGLLRRLRVTPVRGVAVAAAHGVTAVITGAFALVVLLLLARAIFGAESAGRPIDLAIVYLCGACALVPLGLLVGSTARDMRTAPAIANLLFFPLMFLSGSAMPFGMLPDGVRRFARFLPTTYLVDAYSSVIVRGESVTAFAGSLVALVGIGAVGLALVAALFRWEGTEPISKRALAGIAVSFALALGVTALAAPAFRHGEIPTARRIDAGPAAGQVRVLRDVTVLDGLGGRVEHARVVIRDHRVSEVSLDDAATPVPDGAVVEHASGQFVIPGLFDSHVHVGGSGGVGASPIERTDEMQGHNLAASLAAGVTSIVSLTDDLADMRSLSNAVAKGDYRGPRTFFAGPSITATGGHPTELFSFLPSLVENLARQVDTPDEARAAIQELARARVDLVKLVLEPGLEGRALPRLREDVFRAAMAEAKKRGLRTTVHVGTDADVQLAVDAGANGIEHTSRGLTDRTIALLAAKRVTFTPTNVVLDIAWKQHVLDGQDPLASRLAAPGLLDSVRGPSSPLAPMFAPPALDMMRRVHEGSLAQTAKAIRAGVPILAGSDAGNPVTLHGVSLIRELELLAEAGMPLGDVLKAATSRAADRLGQSSLGRLTTGAVADMVLLSADPTESVAAYRHVVAVYLGGRKIDPGSVLGTSGGAWRPGRATDVF